MNPNTDSSSAGLGWDPPKTREVFKENRPATKPTSEKQRPLRKYPVTKHELTQAELDEWWARRSGDIRRGRS